MIKTLFLVPLHDNDGQVFAESDWLALEARLLQFGGFSWVDNVTGVWESGARVYHDISRQYTVSLSHWTQLPAWLDTVAWVRMRFRQEALYIEVANIPDILE